MQCSYDSYTQKYISNLSKKRKDLTMQEEHDLILEMRAKETSQKRINDIQELFICNTILWTVSQVKKNSQNQINADLIQEAQLGILRALETFDISKGLRFITYAQNYIFKYINIFKTEIEPTISIPTNVQKLSKKMAKYDGLEIDLEDIAAELGINETLAQRVANTSRYSYFSKDSDEFNKQLEDKEISEINILDENLFTFLCRIEPLNAQIVRYALGIDKAVKKENNETIEYTLDLYLIARRFELDYDKTKLIFYKTMVEYGKAMNFSHNSIYFKSFEDKIKKIEQLYIQEKAKVVESKYNGTLSLF